LGIPPIKPYFVVKSIAHRRFLCPFLRGRFAFRGIISGLGNGGEGYSIELYKLSDSIPIDFDRKRLPSLPLRGDYTRMIKNWERAPFDSLKYPHIYDIFSISTGNGSLDSLIVHLHTLLNGRQVYYAFYSGPDFKKPTDLEMYIWDPQERILYRFLMRW